jgi:hypothetical protein
MLLAFVLLLLQMMMNFTVDCVRGSKDGVLLLITADAGNRAHSVRQQGGVNTLQLLRCSTWLAVCVTAAPYRH